MMIKSDIVCQSYGNVYRGYFFPGHSVCHRVVVAACHVSCAESCSDDTPMSCDACSSGWQLAADGSGCQGNTASCLCRTVVDCLQTLLLAVFQQASCNVGDNSVVLVGSGYSSSIAGRCV